MPQALVSKGAYYAYGLLSGVAATLLAQAGARRYDARKQANIHKGVSQAVDEMQNRGGAQAA